MTKMDAEVITLRQATISQFIGELSFRMMCQDMLIGMQDKEISDLRKKVGEI